MLADAEVVVAANTSTAQTFKGFVLVDPDLNRQPRRITVCFSNRGTQGGDAVRWIPNGRVFRDGAAWSGEIAALYVELAPMEAQILA